MMATPLMPFWIWLGFGDYPTLRVLAVGGLAIGAVVGEMRSQRQSK